MQKSNIQRIEKIKRGENRFLEFKEKLSFSDNIAKTIIAFSNGAGGELLIGINDKREITGVNDSDIFELQDKISNIIHDMCYPMVIPEIYVENHEGKNIIVVKVFSGSLKPYYLKNEGKLNGAYIRVGATNKMADSESITELERLRRNIGFDEEINYEFDLKEINYEFLKMQFNHIKNREIGITELKNLKLIKEENEKIYPTNAFLIVAGIMENTFTDCARFKGKTTEIFIDKKEYRGDVFSQIENIELFLKNHLKLNAEIRGLKREEKYEIPFEAIREVIMNAFVHRDYSRKGINIKIALFDDVLEITSPGVLPNSITIENIFNEGRSELRNNVIARVFKELNYIERWGTGMSKIKTACENAGLKTPEIKETGSFTQFILHRPAEYRRNTGGTPAVSIGNIDDKATRQTNLILDYMVENKKINLTAAMELLVVKNSRAREILAGMAKDGVIEKKGNGKNTFYIPS